MARQNNLPEFLRSPVVGRIVAAHLGERAADLTRPADRDGEFIGPSLVAEAEAELLRGAASAIRQFHTENGAS